MVIEGIIIFGEKSGMVEELPKSGHIKHSLKAIKLVKEVVGKLEAILDACSQIFLFNLVDELKQKYLYNKNF